MDELNTSDGQPWIELHDSQISSAELVCEVAARAQRRRVDQGTVKIDLPAFGASTRAPDEGATREDVIRLHYYLRQLEQLPAPETQPELAASSATRVPLLGRLWQLIRREAHNLVLFYVNRTVAHNTVTNRHVFSALNEAAALIEEQQAEIERLREELAQLKDEEQ